MKKDFLKEANEVDIYEMSHPYGENPEINEAMNVPNPFDGVKDLVKHYQSESAQPREVRAFVEGAMKGKLGCSLLPAFNKAAQHYGITFEQVRVMFLEAGKNKVKFTPFSLTIEKENQS